MENKQAYSIELYESQRQFLEQMVKEYALPDVDKAVRILVDYARSEEKSRDEIFQEIRCLQC